MDFHGEKLLSGLKDSGFPVELILMGDGEKHKTSEEILSVCEQLIYKGIDRKSLIIPFGGGVTGDLGGFAAATILRGVAYMHIPTTLVSQVDSSIGGKVGVNLSGGKNLWGAFYHPKMVVTDPNLLYTLPRKEFSAGMAEVIKSAVISSPELLEILEKCPGNLEKIRYELLEEIVCRTAKIKVDIVNQDVNEKGERMKLNLGHTLGHGLEKASGYSGYSHGEAVAIGLMGAIEISRRLGLLVEENLEKRVERLLLKFALPVRFSNVHTGQILEAIRFDKKREASKTRFVLPRASGLVELTTPDDENIIRATLENLKEE